jgi:hypothetical protein
MTAKLSAKTGGTILRDTYEMARFERSAGVTAVTDFYNEVRASKLKRKAG